MRIILWLAAAGAAAIATAAQARPAAGPSGPPGAWAAGGGHRAAAGWQGRSRTAVGRDRHRRDGRHGGRGRDEVFFHDGFGIAGSGGIVSPWGDGFFADGGGEVRMRGGRPHYDYDRSYPYEWASAIRAPSTEADGPGGAQPEPRCTIEHGVRVCRGW